MKQNTELPYKGHRKRIKEKYINNGLTGWHEYEILEYALTFAIPRKDTKPLAKTLLNEFKTINGVLDAGSDNLKSIKGISEHTALFLSFLKDISVLYLKSGLYNKDLLSSPQAVFDYLKASLKGLPDEEIRVLFLNNKNCLIAVETLQKGIVNKSFVFPRQIVERALYHHATGIIISHNHPSGEIKPSEEDKQVTIAIQQALNTVEIALLDHIIIGGNNYFSFKENDLF